MKTYCMEPILFDIIKPHNCVGIQIMKEAAKYHATKLDKIPLAFSEYANILNIEIKNQIIFGNAFMKNTL